jgi:integrating conjugative element membrane protein, PFL_4697 family
MSETSNSNNQQAAKPQTLIGKVVSLPFTLFGILCGSLLLSIFVECLGLYFLWPDEGWHHAESVFQDELNSLSDTFTQSIVMSSPVKMADTVLSYVYDWVFIKSGLLEQINNVLTPKDYDSARKLTFRQNLGAAVGQMQNYLLAAAYTTLTFIVRLFVLLLSMPLIVMAIFVGLIDGLVKRDLRRFIVGHESGFIYHRAKAFLGPTLALPWVIYLALPISIPPLLIMLPCAVLVGVIVNITVASFKKYL